MSLTTTLGVMIKELHPQLGTWFIRGHLIRVWDMAHSNDTSKVESSEMVFMDAEGTKIQASITKELLRLIKIPLIEGCLYEIRDALVLVNEGNERPTSHPYRLVIQRHSVFFKVKHRVFNKLGLSSLNSSEIINMGGDCDHLIDKIGLLTSISIEREYVTEEKEVTVVFLEIADPTGKIECVLYDDYVDEVRNYLETNGPIAPIVVVQFARIVSPNHLYFGDAGIETVSNITKVLYSPGIPDVYDMINWLAMTDCLLDGKLYYLHMKMPDEVIRHRFMLHYPKKTIGQLTEEGEHVLYVVWATIMGLVEDECWWFYACKHLTCPPAGQTMNHFGGCYSNIPRFKLKLEVFDGDDSAFFVLADDDLQRLVGRSCEDMLSSFETPFTGSCPEIFTKLIGKNMLFIVDKNRIAGPGEGTYFNVLSACDDREIMRMFLKGECFRVDRMVHGKVSIATLLGQYRRVNGHPFCDDASPAFRRPADIFPSLAFDPGSCSSSATVCAKKFTSDGVIDLGNELPAQIQSDD